MAEIKVKNIYYMLSYAFQTLRETGFANVADENFENIHDLFAAILIRGIGMQIKRGLHRDYLQIEEDLAGIRGQIRIADSIKQLTYPRGKLVCAYDEFASDSLHNQILKSVMWLLLSHGNVKQKNKKSLRRLLLYFNGVTDIAANSIRWDAVKYHRNNASYRMLLGICRLTIKGLLLTTEAGRHRLASWIQCEQMHRLYEKFVLSYYISHHAELQPKSAIIGWDVNEEKKSAYLPDMISDVTLQNGKRKLIIDTKYYESGAMQHNSLYDSSKYISNNLYQIYSYVKNSDKYSTGNVEGVLLYAKTDEIFTPDETIIIGGNRIGVKTLDLNNEWSIITAQLEKLCEWVKNAECI